MFDASGRSITWSAHRSLRRWSLLLFLLLTACADRVVTTVAPGEAPIEVSAVAVYPFQVRHRSEPVVTYQKTVDLVNAALSPRRFQVYSFGDFQLFSLETLDAYEGRSLLATIRSDGLEENRLAILRGEATLAGESRIDGGQPGHRQGDDTLVHAWVELYHYGLKMPISRAEATFPVNPLDAGQIDPYPELTRQVRRLADVVVKRALTRVKAPEPHPSLPIHFYADQSLLFKIASDDTPSIARRMLSQDEISQDSELLRGYQYFHPEITMLQVLRLAQTPGLLVTSLDAPWLQEQGLKIDDLITHVNGARVSTAHQLDRQLARSTQGPLKLTVVRAGKDVVLEVKRP